jgi:hypothetical protein
VKSKSPDFIEKVGRSLWFRAVVYLLPILYAVRLILMVVTPQAYHMPGWRTVLWQGARDASVVLNLFFWQRYFANYTARRSSLTYRRRDAWKLPLVSCLYISLEFPPLLGLSWFWVALASLVLGFAFYASETGVIKGRVAHP